MYKYTALLLSGQAGRLFFHHRPIVWFPLRSYRHPDWGNGWPAA